MNSEVIDDATFDVLNAVLLKKMASAGTVAELTGRSVDEVERYFTDLERREAIFLADSNALSTETGTTLIKAFADRHYASLRADETMAGWHARFEPLNRQLLAAITAWQTVDAGGAKFANDHSDPAYDDKVLSRIEGIVAKMGRLLDEFGAKVPRFVRYRDRLDTALEKAYAGETRYISDVQLDSIHSIWFEMHEDILLVLGLERNDAG